jgi:hypothetical protein
LLFSPIRTILGKRRPVRRRAENPVSKTLVYGEFAMRRAALAKWVILTATILTAASAFAQDYRDFRRNSHWIPAAGGGIPEGAVIGGNENNGEPLFVCSAPFNDSMQPGKIRPSFGGCDIAYGGKEVVVPQYEVLMQRPGYGWVPARDGYIPPGAVRGGHENGEGLFVCQAGHDGGMHPGKIRPEFGGCNIPFGGHEITSTAF